MIYLKTFETEEAYNAYMTGDPALPNTSKVTTGGTHYTPLAPIPTNIIIKYRTNDGQSIVNSFTNSADMHSFDENTGEWVLTFSGLTEIPQNAFMYDTTLISITISNGITKIGEGAFFGLDELASIVIPASVRIMEGSIIGYWGGDEPWTDIHLMSETPIDMVNSQGNIIYPFGNLEDSESGLHVKNIYVPSNALQAYLDKALTDTAWEYYVSLDLLHAEP